MTSPNRVTYVMVERKVGDLWVANRAFCLQGTVTKVAGDLSRCMDKNNDGVLSTSEDLNGDAWDLLPMHRYRAHNWQCFGDVGQRQPYASIATSFADQQRTLLPLNKQRKQPLNLSRNPSHPKLSHPRRRSLR